MWQRVFTLLLLLTLGAQAEMKFVNFTGEALEIDLLAGSSQVTGQKLGPAPVVSETLGGKVGLRGEEVLVVRSAGGQELFREKRQAGFIYVLSYGSQKKFKVTVAGRFLGEPGSRISVINATGRKLALNTTLPNGTSKVRKVDKAGANGVRRVTVNSGVDHLDVEVEGAKARLEKGRVYLLTDSSGLKFTEAGYH